MHTATASETEPRSITDEEKARRRRVRVFLKEEVKKASGFRATILCMAISHTRRKLHCETYALYDGGWRGGSPQKKRASMKKRDAFTTARAVSYLKKFGSNLNETEELNYANAVIENLADQADFLVKYLDEDDKRAALLPGYREQGRTIYSWMEPRFEPKLRMILRRIVDSVEVS